MTNVKALQNQHPLGAQAAVSILGFPRRASSLSHPWGLTVVILSSAGRVCSYETVSTPQQADGRQAARVQRRQHALPFKQHVQTDSTAPTVPAQQTPTSLSPPQQFPEPGVGTQVYTTAPLKRTFPEDPSYGSGLERIHNLSSQTISELYLFYETK